MITLIKERIASIFGELKTNINGYIGLKEDVAIGFGYNKDYVYFHKINNDYRLYKYSNVFKYQFAYSEFLDKFKTLEDFENYFDLFKKIVKEYENSRKEFRKNAYKKAIVYNNLPKSFNLCGIDFNISTIQASYEEGYSNCHFIYRSKIIGLDEYTPYQDFRIDYYVTETTTKYGLAKRGPNKNSFEVLSEDLSLFKEKIPFDVVLKELEIKLSKIIKKRNLDIQFTF